MKKKYLAFALAVSTFTFGVLVSFTNMSTLPDQLTPLLQESQKMNDRLGDPSLSSNAKEFYRQHKLLVSNVIAAKVGAKTCSDLYAVDSTVLTGKYTLFPDGSPALGAKVECVSPAVVLQIINSILLED